MTITSYNRLRDALIQQRREVTASPQAASRFIDQLGLRDVVITPEKTTPSKPAVRKAPVKKAKRK